MENLLGAVEIVNPLNLVREEMKYENVVRQNKRRRIQQVVGPLSLMSVNRMFQQIRNWCDNEQQSTLSSNPMNDVDEAEKQEYLAAFRCQALDRHHPLQLAIMANNIPGIEWCLTSGICTNETISDAGLHIPFHVSQLPKRTTLILMRHLYYRTTLPVVIIRLIIMYGID
jgi:hypothetical protein